MSLGSFFMDIHDLFLHCKLLTSLIICLFTSTLNILIEYDFDFTEVNKCSTFYLYIDYIVKPIKMIFTVIIRSRK